MPFYNLGARKADKEREDEWPEMTDTVGDLYNTVCYSHILR